MGAANDCVLSICNEAGPAAQDESREGLLLQRWMRISGGQEMSGRGVNG